MAKIKVSGSAKREYPADNFRVDINICAEGSSTGEAVRAGNKRIEELLIMMRDSFDISPENFQSADYSVRHQPYRDSSGYNYHRLVSIQIAAELDAVENIVNIFKDMDNINFNIVPLLSNETEKAKELMMLAVEDSRQKAQMLADAMGLKITGAEDVRFEFSSDEDNPVCEEAYRGAAENDSLARKMKKPVIEISKEIQIIWNAE